MSKNNHSKKGWGGPFDFNWDGKTTWEEASFGVTLTDQLRKNRESSSSYSSYGSSHEAREPKSTPKKKPLSAKEIVPEVVDEYNYDALLSGYRIECFSGVVALIILLIPAFFVLWLVHSANDPYNSASGFINIAGLIYGGMVFSIAGERIGTSLECIKLVKKRYSESVIRESKNK